MWHYWTWDIDCKNSLCYWPVFLHHQIQDYRVKIRYIKCGFVNNISNSFSSLWTSIATGYFVLITLASSEPDFYWFKSFTPLWCFLPMRPAIALTALGHMSLLERFNSLSSPCLMLSSSVMIPSEPILLFLRFTMWIFWLLSSAIAVLAWGPRLLSDRHNRWRPLLFIPFC